jgi:prepilin-type N-terminal cleavage/methylation domain-containing protein
MPRRRGYTLVELLFAILIITIVVMTSLAVFVERTRRLRTANETILVYQALANEAELRRRIDFAELDTAPATFISDTSLLGSLNPYTTNVAIDSPRVGVKNLTMSVMWRGGVREAKMTIVRVNTGGTNLW